MTAHLKIGIYGPQWLLARHNTDYALMRAFRRMSEYEPLDLSFVSGWQHTLSFNTRKVLHRCALPMTPLLHGLASASAIDAIYHYGNPENPRQFYRTAGDRPVVVTSGLMTGRYLSDGATQTEELVRREADLIARHAERAAAVHFHLEGGKERFLAYHPEFRGRTVMAPFFLPNLELAPALEDWDDPKKPVKLLFVGYEGKRKGLDDLMEALEILGVPFLRRMRVELTVVSRDVPRRLDGLTIRWHRRLPYNEVQERMREADIFVMVPRRESYGLVFLEAMAANCAIIADDDEPRREVLGGTGRHVAPRHPRQLGDALRELIENPSMRHELRSKAKIRLTQAFLPATVARSYREIFTAVVGTDSNRG